MVKLLGGGIGKTYLEGHSQPSLGREEKICRRRSWGIEYLDRSAQKGKAIADRKEFSVNHPRSQSIRWTRGVVSPGHSNTEGNLNRYQTVIRKKALTLHPSKT